MLRFEDLDSYIGFENEDDDYSNRFRLVLVDLALPLESQLDSAKSELIPDKSRTLNSLRSHARRNRVDKWPEYLRVLDAREAGETFRHIGEVLYGDLIPSNIEDDRRTDKVESKYRSAVKEVERAHLSISRFK